jgi:hypothetical protein
VKNSALREKLSKSLAAAEQKIAQSKFLRRAGNVGGVVYILMSADMLVDSRKEIEEETNPQVKIQLEQRHNALAQTLIADAAVFGLTPSAAFSTLAGSILGPIAIASTIGYAGNYAYDVRTELAEWSKDASDWSKVPGARTLKEIEETIGEMDSRGRSAGFGTPRVIGWFESQGKTDERIDRIEDHNAGLREEMFRGYFKQTTLASFPKRNDESENQYEARISEMTSDKVVFVEKVTHGDFDSTYNKMLVSADTYAELMSMRKEYEKKGVPAVIEYNALDGSDRNIDLTELDIRSNPEKTREIMGQYKYEYEPLKHLSDIDMANDRRAAAASSLQMKIYVDFVHARNKIPHVEDIQKLRQGALEQASSLLLEEIENRSITIEKYNDYMQKIESIFLAESPGELHESMTKQAIEDMHSREDELGEIANASVESRRHSDEDEKLTPVSDEISAMEKNPDSFVRINGYDPVMQHEGWIVRDVSHTLPIHFFREHTRKDPSNLDGVSGTVVRTSPESTHRFMARKNSGEEIEFSIYDASELDADKNENADLLEHILTTPSDKSLARVVSLFPSEVTSGRSWRMHLLQNIKNMYKSSDKKREFLQQLLGKLRKESAGKGYLSQDDAVSIQSWFIENQDRFSE